MSLLEHSRRTSTAFVSALFFTLATASAHSISLTPFHLVGVSRDNRTTIFVPAKEVKLGDSLRVVSEGRVIDSPVIQVNEEMKQGIYAPLTTTGTKEAHLTMKKKVFLIGTLLVNGVLASSYANVHSHDAAHVFMAPLRFYYALAQGLLAVTDPFRSQDQDGMHAVPRMMFDVATFLAPSNLLLP